MRQGRRLDERESKRSVLRKTDARIDTSFGDSMFNAGLGNGFTACTVEPLNRL